MNANVSPYAQKVREARAISKTRQEMADLLGLPDVKNVYDLLKREGLPPFGTATIYHSEDIKKQVIADYRTGKKLKDIAADLGITTMAIGGILYRAGVKRDRPLPVAKPVARPIRHVAFQVPKIKPDRFEPRIADVAPLDIPFLDIGPNQCRQMYGDDPRTMTFCGHECYGVTPYCEAHFAINYLPPQSRNRAPRPR